MISFSFRHPIPDYYSITLEISRDRITTARHVLCDDSDPYKPECPRGYHNRDLYLSRSLNDPCEKMVSNYGIKDSLNNVYIVKDSLVNTYSVNDSSGWSHGTGCTDPCSTNPLFII